MKIVSREEIIQRLKNKFPNSPFELIEYTKITKPVIIKCLTCGKENKSSSFNNFYNKKTLCTCLNPNCSTYKHEANKNKIIEICKNNLDLEFISFGYREKVKKYSVQVKCLICNSIFDKDWEQFLLNQTCPFCQSGHNLNAVGLQKRLPKDYTLIGEYKGTEEKTLIRHSCGFIWKIKPHTLLSKINRGYIGCPHCNHKKSQGELKISYFLKNKKINFFNEYIFPWSSNSKFRYDFYIPDYNLIIEYHGEQHYKEVSFFHDTLEQRQKYDEIKEKEAKENGFNYLIIPYTDFKNIETILINWFNDYPARE